MAQEGVTAGVEAAMAKSWVPAEFQGNRNPLIDHPRMGEADRLCVGLGAQALAANCKVRFRDGLNRDA